MALNSSTIIGGASPVHKRSEADFYATPPDCTVALLNDYGRMLGHRVWEPACGDGAISEVLTAAGKDVFSTDLRHTGFGTGGVDALGTRPENIDSIVTNPPFNLAVQFIRHLRSLHLPFALLLKATFWHAASRRALFRETGPLAVCPLLWRPAMDPSRGKSATMDFCWTVWTDAPVPSCDYTPLPRPDMSGFTTDNEDPFA